MTVELVGMDTVGYIVLKQSDIQRYGESWFKHWIGS